MFLFFFKKKREKKMLPLIRVAPIDGEKYREISGNGKGIKT